MQAVHKAWTALLPDPRVAVMTRGHRWCTAAALSLLLLH